MFRDGVMLKRLPRLLRIVTSDTSSKTSKVHSFLVENWCRDFKMHSLVHSDLSRCGLHVFDAVKDFGERAKPEPFAFVLCPAITHACEASLSALVGRVRASWHQPFSVFPSVASRDSQHPPPFSWPHLRSVKCMQIFNVPNIQNLPFRRLFGRRGQNKMRLSCI